ncbi:hypothetical protein [Crateriforma conspicua]|uniref:Uncharacterized protein n=1 Tax=Crateriforma conspicua TaxID=2527996 RepID=A0A5C5YC76_9PLAN|nr:hypothetical protein [Crateriforma conspicua]QDV61364.1 hypothetical protein Mal65_04870 [Crateriforma conspicua]TWT72383.1 hypothetical protein Pan14r_47030 [Crateriforma conspicua]
MERSWKHLAAVGAAIVGSIGWSAVAVAQSFDGQIISSHVVSDEVVGTTGSVDGMVVDGGVVDGGTVVDGSMAGGSVAQRRDYGQPDLFYNYYTQGNANSANAQMYVSPVPVPAFVGHTFNTYQPWYPHHYLYWHVDRYHNNYDNGRGMNRTKAVYYSPPVRQAASNFYWNVLRIPR